MLAWNGWKTRMPADWRPLKLEGNAPEGHMLVGDGERPVFQVSWREWGKRRIAPETWIERRTGDSGIRQDTPGFDAAAVVESAERWALVAANKRFGVVLSADAQLTKNTRRRIKEMVFGSFEAVETGAPTPWAVFGAHFETPAGFRYKQASLRLGDIALELRARGGGRLVVRQVYPGKLALSRRPLEKWLEHTPFPQRLRIKGLSVEPWPIEFGAGLMFEGRLATRLKSLAVPLNFLARRYSCTAAVWDESLDRLLIVERDARVCAAARTIEPLIASMNRAGREREAA